MRSFNPEDDYDVERLGKINAEQWQIDLLDINPDPETSYHHWGNFEDYMCDKDAGWRTSHEFDSFSEVFEADDLNEYVNFYFQITRDCKECSQCKGQGLNEATLKIYNDWYAFDNPNYVYVDKDYRYNDNAWQNHITQNEVDVLWDEGRLTYSFKEKPTAEEVNEWSRGRGMGHDSINQWICTEARAKNLGVYGKCVNCRGDGVIYTSDKATVSLQLWQILPRKGCSRGIFVKSIEQSELPDVYKFLRNCADRNAERFSRIPEA